MALMLTELRFGFLRREDREMVVIGRRELDGRRRYWIGLVSGGALLISLSFVDGIDSS